MTTQAVSAFFQTASGKALTLQNQSVTDGTLTEIQSGGDGLNVVSGVSLGQYGAGETITHGFAIATDCPVCAFIEDQNGKIIMPVVFANAASGVAGIVPLCAPVNLVTGMTFKVHTTDSGGSATPNAAFSAYCADGSAEVFTTSLTNGSTTQFSSVQTSQSIGQTLSGKTIMKGLTSTFADLDAAEATGFGGYSILSSDGYTKAVYAPSSVLYAQQAAQMFPVRIAQNDTMQATYDAS